MRARVAHQVSHPTPRMVPVESKRRQKMATQKTGTVAQRPSLDPDMMVFVTTLGLSTLLWLVGA